MYFKKEYSTYEWNELMPQIKADLASGRLLDFPEMIPNQMAYAGIQSFHSLMLDTKYKTFWYIDGSIASGVKTSIKQPKVEIF
jgi:hypothetical protein